MGAEPFRWLGVHSMYQLYRIADGREAAGLAHTSKLAAIADSLTNGGYARPRASST